MNRFQILFNTILIFIMASGSKGLSSTSKTAAAGNNKILKLISFDLDDTLFPVTETIQESNDAMINKMVNDFGAKGVTNESVREANVRIRKALEAPITYTELRIRSIQSELERCCETIEGESRLAAENVFDSWLKQRQATANERLFPKVPETLALLRNTYPSAKIIAITNGRGSPDEMGRISEYFDLCVSGEDDDVFPHRKPHLGIYEVALAKAGLKLPLDENECWVHIGDDLANDVGASFELGALTVHVKIIHDERPNSIFYSTAPESEQEERRKKDEEARGKVGESIRSIDQLPAAIASLII